MSMNQTLETIFSRSSYRGAFEERVWFNGFGKQE